MIRCVVLDLDGTLADTSALDDLRTQGRWREVENRLQHVVLYDEAVEIFHTARAAGIKVALFTNSPANYARQVLKHLDLTVDLLVAYHDVRQHKPASEGIDKIRAKLGISCEELIYIGDSEDDKQCAHNAHVRFFAADWDAKSSHSLSSTSVEDILEFIGSDNRQDPKSHTRSPLLQNGQHFYLGYYLSGVKQEVWSFKEDKKKSINRWVDKTLEVCPSLPHIDVVVRALGHAELSAGTERTPLDQLGVKLAATIGASYRPDGLSKSSALRKSTECSARERQKQVDGVYSAASDMADAIYNTEVTFLIIDDVLTSGATTREMARALSEAYSNARVYVFTLVKTLYRAESVRESEEAQHNAQLFSDLYNTAAGRTEVADHVIAAAPKRRRAHLVSKTFSANYARTNHNFVFQNLRSYSIASESLSTPILNAVYVLRNMLQRGKPTIASKRLRHNLGLEPTDSGLNLAPVALISPQPVDWKRLIKGNTCTGQFPAEHFFAKQIDAYFGEYRFVKQLTLPEVNIFDMTQVYVEQFHNRQVDFFIPQAGLIIEIDGPQHLGSVGEDEMRDAFTRTLGLTTVRLTTEEIAAENDSFFNKIARILAHLKMVDRLEQEGILCPPNGLTLQDYRNAYSNAVSTADPALRLTAALRWQLLILELIERGDIRLGQMARVALCNRDGIPFVQAATEDLAEMLAHLLVLMGVPGHELKLNVEEVPELSGVQTDETLLIDFSILQRFDDSYQVNPDTVYARTHYFDFYRHLPQKNATSMESVVLVDYDFFQMSCAEPIRYQLDLSPNSPQRQSLRFFLGNLFLPFVNDVDFREGQIGIIGSALSRAGTIGLLPTGAGKSICYQLSAVLQPAISFVVCPIKSLMYDQKADLDTIGFTRSNFITGDLTPDQKVRIQNDFGRGKYFFVFISPERFQTHAFRSEMSAIGLDRTFAYAVIDEAHCLSEWGHDFRTSYLNLANTIEKLAPDASYIGLTATASVNVLKDIQSEFNIPDENVRTPLDYTRKELVFHVVDDKGRKTDALLKIVGEMEAKWNPTTGPEPASKAGIVFTPTVNGAKGCYELAGRLASSLKQDVRYFSGSAPKGSLQGDAFDAYKHQVQKDFKANRYRLLTATKAFGMGVNKGNIAYTVHCGIPGSMEALYQEAGRAGRDKQQFQDNPADCFVMLTRESNTALLDKIWDSATTVAELKESAKRLSRDSDVNTNMFLLTSGLDTINDDYKLLDTIYQHLLQNSDASTIVATASQFRADKPKFEKAIYRLFQLGIVSDWIVEDFFNGKLLIEFSCPNEEQLGKNLEARLRKYDTTYTLVEVFKSRNPFHQLLCERLQKRAITQTQFIFLVLLLWSYDHFVYNRRQSLKTVYEQCSELAADRITEADFKERLEAYFKFNESSLLLSQLAENPTDPSNWLSVFFEKDAAKGSEAIVSQAKLVTLREQLARFLESYKDNMCLNYLSGVIRLIADEFDDADGERRMAASLDRLKHQGSESVEDLIRRTMKLKPLLSVNAQCRYARLIDESFPDTCFLNLVNSEFADPYSYRQLLAPMLSRLEAVTNRYKGISW
jgi:ATP-dependent DNA helicase RecQ